MLNDKEKRVLSYYALLPSIIKASIWMILGVILLTFLLEIINEVYTNGHSPNDLGIIMAFFVIIFFIVTYFWGRSALKKASHNATWKAITEKIDAVYISDYARGKEVSLADISKAKKSAYRSSFDQYLNVAFNIFDYYPKTTLKRVLFVVLPCLLLVGSYIPTYMQNYAIIEANRAEVIKVMTALSEAFASYNVMYDDPYEQYYEYGYYFTAIDANFEDHIALNILNDGCVDFVSYRLTVDLTIDKDENLEDMQNRLNQFYELLLLADITIDEKYLTAPILDDSFIAIFLGDSEYQYFNYGQGSIDIDFYAYPSDSTGSLYFYIF